MATQKELGIKSAVFDGDCFYLFSDDEATDEYLVEDWPEDWPELVSKSFLEKRNINVFEA